MRQQEPFFSKQISRILEIKEIKVLQKINLFLFPFFYFLMLVFIGIESYMYSGFLQRHILIGLQGILVLYVISGVWAKLSLSRAVSKQIYSYYQLISTLNKLFLPVITFIVFLLLSIENVHYPGYVYTQVLHIEPKILFFSFLVAVFILILDFTESLTDLLEDVGIGRVLPQKSNYLYLLLLTLFAWIFLGNILKSTSFVYTKLQFVLKNPRLTDEEKMMKGWGRFYDYMMFINENTPPDAAILHPQHYSPWEKVGNGGLVRYFIYPRDEVYFSKGISTKGNRPTHMMIAYGWPDFEVEAEKLIYMPKTATKSAEIIYQDYNPDEPRNKDKEVLGLIELKKE
jgi:hypothetical protein